MAKYRVTDAYPGDEVVVGQEFEWDGEALSFGHYVIGPRGWLFTPSEVELIEEPAQLVEVARETVTETVTTEKVSGVAINLTVDQARELIEDLNRAASGWIFTDTTARVWGALMCEVGIQEEE